MDKIQVYTDGSCRNKSGDCGAFAVVMLYKEHIKEFSFGAYCNTTSARQELRAIIHGLRIIMNKSIPVELFGDNRYTIDCIAKGWIYKWEKEGWYNRTNSDLLRELLFEYRQFPDGNVKFNWLRGHSGHQWNERADQLAGIAAKSENIIDCRMFEFK